MKTIDEIRAEIKATHERQMEELRALDAELDAIRAAVDGEKQWPMDCDTYFTVTGKGTIASYFWRDDSDDKLFAEFGNCFRTKAEAEKHRDWLKAVAEIRRMIGGNTGNYYPEHTEHWTKAVVNPFGCHSSELARQVASSPAFKTFLGVD